MINILVLAAGRTTEKDIEEYPVCLMEFDGEPMIERVLHTCQEFNPNRTLVALPREDVRRFHLDKIVKLLADTGEVLEIRGQTRGAVCTALLSINQINNDDELLIMNGNDIVDIHITEVISHFRKSKLDAGTITFPSVHPRYSYVKTDDKGLVLEAAEKKPISRHATTGIFWFAKGSDFVRAGMNLIRKDASVNGSYYICPTLNEMILEQKKIGTFEIQANLYHPLKNLRQIGQYEASLERGDLQ